MKFHINNNPLWSAKSDCLVVGLFDNGELTLPGKKIDKLTHGYLNKTIKTGEISGKIGETLLLHDLKDLPAKRVLLVGCGKPKPLTAFDFRKIISSSLRVLLSTKSKTAIYFLADLSVLDHTLPWRIKQMMALISQHFYQFNQYKSKPDPEYPLKEINFYSDKKLSPGEIKKIISESDAISSGATLTKNIANQPSNVCTPSYLAHEARALAKKYRSLKTTVLEERDMAKLGMGAFLAVAKGSDQDAKLICLEYKGGSKKQAPIALVGKGITFDTGGISLKPADSMVGMKYDMCGAATVLGTMKAVAELKLPINVVGILAAAENMPGGKASKPEDIVTTLSGQTVEIMNTDAEGRLVLCDALTYCERFKPDTVIDIATLTGAVVIALGIHATGLLSNYQPLADELIAAGQEAHDRVWQMPLWEDYQEQLKSPFADMSNVGGRSAGTITAACFLSRFAKKFHWAHLDVAGTAAMMMGGNDRYATGRPVPLLTQFLINRCKK